MGYNNIGPNYWKGEEGRLALIKGEQKLTDAAWWLRSRNWRSGRTIWETASKPRPTRTARTSSPLAVPPSTRRVVEISGFNTQAQFKMGAFPPPVAAAGDTCYISDHTDIAIGMNAKSPNAEAAKKFLEWVGSPEFATMYANALPGFFSLNSTPVEMKDPLAQEFVSWRGKCQSTIRSHLPDPVARHAEP